MTRERSRSSLLARALGAWKTRDSRGKSLLELEGGTEEEPWLVVAQDQQNGVGRVERETGKPGEREERGEEAGRLCVLHLRDKPPTTWPPSRLPGGAQGRSARGWC